MDKTTSAFHASLTWTVPSGSCMAAVKRLPITYSCRSWQVSGTWSQGRQTVAQRSGRTHGLHEACPAIHTGQQQCLLLNRPIQLRRWQADFLARAIMESGHAALLPMQMKVRHRQVAAGEQM